MDRIPLGRLLPLAFAPLLVGAPSAGSAGPPPLTFAGTYAGTTSQGYPVVIVVSADGRQVRRAVSSLFLTCSDGQSALVRDEFAAVPLSVSGKAVSMYAGAEGEGFDGAPATYSGSFSSAIVRGNRRLSGTWEETQTVHNTDGTTRVCSSGKVTLKASGRQDPADPLGGFYGGLTKKGLPVVMQLARAGRKLTAIRGLFVLKCSLGGVRVVSDSWVQLPISGGSRRFAASARDQVQRFSDGSPYQVSASISGTIERGGRAAKGRWRVFWKVPEAEATDTCDSGPVAFRVTR